MLKPKRSESRKGGGPGDVLHLSDRPASSDERMVEFVRALARCAAHRYIAGSEKEGARDAS